MIGMSHRAERFDEIRLARSLGRMQPVPALDCQSVAAQFVVAGDAPDVRADAVLFGQDLLRFQRFVQDRTAAEQSDLRGHRSRKA